MDKLVDFNCKKDISLMLKCLGRRHFCRITNSYCCWDIRLCTNKKRRKRRRRTSWSCRCSYLKEAVMKKLYWFQAVCNTNSKNIYSLQKTIWKNTNILKYEPSYRHEEKTSFTNKKFVQKNYHYLKSRKNRKSSSFSRH